MLKATFTSVYYISYPPIGDVWAESGNENVSSWLCQDVWTTSWRRSTLGKRRWLIIEIIRKLYRASLMWRFVIDRYSIREVLFTSTAGRQHTWQVCAFVAPTTYLWFKFRITVFCAFHCYYYLLNINKKNNNRENPNKTLVKQMQ